MSQVSIDRISCLADNVYCDDRQLFPEFCKFLGRLHDEAINALRRQALNTEIMLRLQEAGTAVPTEITVRGRHRLRVAINNHCTRRADLQLLVNETVRLGMELEDMR